jgi:hypothetical protein
MYTICWHTIHCLCLSNMIAPWWWLQQVAETFRSAKCSICAAAGNKTSVWILMFRSKVLSTSSKLETPNSSCILECLDPWKWNTMLSRNFGIELPIDTVSYPLILGHIDHRWWHNVISKIRDRIAHWHCVISVKFRTYWLWCWHNVISKIRDRIAHWHCVIALNFREYWL